MAGIGQLAAELASEEEVSNEEFADAWIALGSRTEDPAIFLLVSDDVGSRAVCHLAKGPRDPMSSASRRFLTRALQFEGNRARADEWLERCRQQPRENKDVDPQRIAASVKSLMAKARKPRLLTAGQGSGKSVALPLLSLLSEMASNLSDESLIQTAAEFASRHSDLQGETERIRSLLAFQAARNELVHRVAGTPRALLESEDLLVSAASQAATAGEAIGRIWEERMLKPSAAAVALGAKPSNREKVRRHREHSWLLGLPRGNGYLYPAFQFDLNRRELYEEVRRVNEALRAREDPWGVASWWLSPNDYLESRPFDLVGTSRSSDVIRASQALTESVG